MLSQIKRPICVSLYRNSLSSEISMAKRPSHRRGKPGSHSTGRYFHIAVRPAREFMRFRTQDVGRRGGVQRLAGQRANGTWETQKWLIEKSDAHIESGDLWQTVPRREKCSRASVQMRFVSAEIVLKRSRAAIFRRLKSPHQPCAEPG